MKGLKVMASRFKATYLAVLDEIGRSRRPGVTTKWRSTEDSVRLLAEEDAAYYSTGETWRSVRPTDGRRSEG